MQELGNGRPGLETTLVTKQGICVRTCGTIAALAFKNRQHATLLQGNFRFAIHLLALFLSGVQALALCACVVVMTGDLQR
eukprot:6214822-Pleurochrysis_carterae.AAC.2